MFIFLYLFLYRLLFPSFIIQLPFLHLIDTLLHPRFIYCCAFLTSSAYCSLISFTAILPSYFSRDYSSFCPIYIVFITFVFLFLLIYFAKLNRLLPSIFVFYVLLSFLLFYIILSILAFYLFYFIFSYFIFWLYYFMLVSVSISIFLALFSSSLLRHLLLLRFILFSDLFIVLLLTFVSIYISRIYHTSISFMAKIFCDIYPIFYHFFIFSSLSYRHIFFSTSSVCIGTSHKILFFTLLLSFILFYLI